MFKFKFNIGEYIYCQIYRINNFIISVEEPNYLESKKVEKFENTVQKLNTILKNYQKLVSKSKKKIVFLRQKYKQYIESSNSKRNNFLRINIIVKFKFRLRQLKKKKLRLHL